MFDKLKKAVEGAKDAVKKVERTVRYGKTVVVDSPLVGNRRGLAKELLKNPEKLIGRPRGGGTASPQGSRLRVPRQQPEAVAPQDPFTKELRITPREVSKVLDKTSTSKQRKQKERD